MAFASEVSIVFGICIRCIEQAEAIFKAKYPTGCVINTFLRHATFIYKFLQQGAEIEVVRLHRHVDAGVDGHFDSLFLVVSHVFTGIEVVDVCPVGHYHSVPVQVFFKPLCKQFVVCVNRAAVD